ncbi:MAG: NrfD/PsrC family molybdoenzyme membrane anchor subunit [Anaerolineae bacterium]|nr:polysulfide reductase NrfD [Anaerolineae bacterium]MDW8300241.1 NrfD/PsrC family molybdoenzyme membrane anchor subunit [Anaerolineae bacterium]
MAQVVSEQKRPAAGFRLTDLIWILGVVALLIGATGMLDRLRFGLAPAAIGSYVPWGLWVSFYDYLVWLEVGSLLLFSGLVYLAHNESLAKIKPLVLFTGFVVLLMALILVAMDLGHFERFWHVYVYADFDSMITWMVWLHTAYLILLAAELFLALRGTGKGLLKVLGIVSLPLGLMLILVSGSIFGVVAARPLWNTSNLPLMFFISALASGASLLLLLVTVFWADKQSEEYTRLTQRLAQIAGWLMLGGTFIAGVLAFTILYQGGGNPQRAAALQLILAGPFWWSFWIVHIGLGVIVPVVIYFVFYKNRWLLMLGAALSVITFVAVTLNIVIPVLVTPELEGLAEAYQHQKLSLDYVPNLNEWLVVTFVFGFGALLYGLGLRFLPVLPKRAQE